MTREEAIANLKMIGVAFVDVNTVEQAKIIDETFNIAIKALEQEHIIDKIRAEIELEKLGYPPSAGYFKAIIKVLQIIDKYMSESEEKE